MLQYYHVKKHSYFFPAENTLKYEVVGRQDPARDISSCIQLAADRGQREVRGLGWTRNYFAKHFVDFDFFERRNFALELD